MSVLRVFYFKGYKYQIAEDLVFKTNIKPSEAVVSDRGNLELSLDGTLTVRAGYAFDGPSGPIIDRKTNMAAAAVHDGLYQLMREEKIPHKNWRAADYEYARILKDNGSWSFTVKYNLWGLKIVGGSAALPKNRKKVHQAP